MKTQTNNPVSQRSLALALAPVFGLLLGGCVEPLDEAADNVSTTDLTTTGTATGSQSDTGSGSTVDTTTNTQSSSTATDSTATGTSSDTGTNSESTQTSTETDSSTSDTGCSSDAMCTDPLAPACDLATGNCVTCIADMHCSDPLLPACLDQACVACTDNQHCSTNADSLLVCNSSTLENPAGTNTCVQCVVDSDCPSNLPFCQENACVPCEAPEGDVLAQCRGPMGNPAVCVTQHDAQQTGLPVTGECLNDMVIFVGAPGNCADTPANGNDRENPVCTLGFAIARIEAAGVRTKGTIIVSPEVVFSESIRLDTARVAIIADVMPGSQLPALRRPKLKSFKETAPAVELTAGSALYLHDMDIVDSASGGLGCLSEGADSYIELNRSKIVNSFDLAVKLTGKCSAQFERVEVLEHKVEFDKGHKYIGGGTIFIDGAKLSLTNSIIANNNTPPDDAVIRVARDGNARLFFSTIAANRGWLASDIVAPSPLIILQTGGTAEILDCVLALNGASNSNSNSVCKAPACNVKFSATNDTSLSISFPGGATRIDSLPSGFTSTGRLQPFPEIGVLANIGVFDMATPATDIDNNLRKASAGQTTTPGASVLAH